jgi:hypothetical protein
MRLVAVSFGVLLLLAGCAAAPPDPSRPHTVLEMQAYREARIAQAASAAERAGKDGQALSATLHRQWCDQDAGAVSDVRARAAAVEACASAWPNPSSL